MNRKLICPWIKTAAVAKVAALLALAAFAFAYLSRPWISMPMRLALTRQSIVLVIQGENPLLSPRWTRALVAQPDLGGAVGIDSSRVRTMELPDAVNWTITRLLAWMNRDLSRATVLAQWVTAATGRELIFLNIYPQGATGPFFVLNSGFIFTPLRSDIIHTPVIVHLDPEVLVVAALSDEHVEYPITVMRDEYDVNSYPPYIDYFIRVTGNALLRSEGSDLYRLASLDLEGRLYLAECVWSTVLNCRPEAGSDLVLEQRLRKQTAWAELNIFSPEIVAGSPFPVDRAKWIFTRLLNTCQSRPLKPEEQRLMQKAYGYSSPFMRPGQNLVAAMQTCASVSSGRPLRLMADEIKHQWQFESRWSSQ